MSNLFCEYKIDYNHPLGSGVFGDVYAVTKRPTSEKGCFSYLFPYAYDYIFRPDDKKTATELDVCVKISKSSLRIWYERCTNPYYYMSYHIVASVYSFLEASREQETNHLLRKHKISNIEFYKTNSIYSQFKTRVHGKTLAHYLETKQFYFSANFTMRKTFVELLRNLFKSNLCFRDVHSGNVMYDEDKMTWEIVDGTVTEKGDMGVKDLLLCLLPKAHRDLLFEQVQIEDEYTLETDFKIFSKFTKLDFDWKSKV